MEIQFKIIDLIEDEDKTCGIKMLIASINIIHNTIQSQAKTFSLFFDMESDQAKALIKNPNLNYSVDLESFVIKKIQFDYIDNDYGYFHYKLLEKFENDKTDLELDKLDIKNSINECLFSCHAEMYLYFNYKVVLNRDFNKINYNYDFKKSILNKLRNVISVILKENFELITDEYKILSIKEVQGIKNKYEDSIDYAQGFIDSIAYFVINNENATYVSSEVLNDREYSYNIYIQQVFIKALSICEKRIIEQQDSENYFGHELVSSDERTELKIFPTPYGFTKVEEIAELSKSGKIDEYLINYLSLNHFYKIEGENSREVLKTKWVFKHKDIITPFYVDRRYSLNKVDFGKQNRNDLFNSLMNMGQINLSLSSNIPYCV